MEKIAQNDVTEVLSGDRYANRDSTVMVHHRDIFDRRAEFAQEMIRAWGMVVAQPAAEGEVRDSRGLTIMTPADVVARACDVAELAHQEFAKRGWTFRIPSYEELNSPES